MFESETLYDYVTGQGWVARIVKRKPKIGERVRLTKSAGDIYAGLEATCMGYSKGVFVVDLRSLNRSSNIGEFWGQLPDSDWEIV